MELSPALCFMEKFIASHNGQAAVDAVIVRHKFASAKRIHNTSIGQNDVVLAVQ